MEAYEKFTHAGLEVELFYEEDGEFADPRDSDNIGTMFCWHPNYTLGDEQFPSDALPEFESMEAVESYLIEDRGAVAVLPLYLLDHSGISMSAGAPSPFDNPRVSSDHHGNALGWDTSHVDYIYTTRERIEELCGPPRDGDEFYCPADWTGTPREWIEHGLDVEIRYYSAWLEGSVLGYVVRDHEDNVLESCGGYVCIGETDIEHLRSEAKTAAECERDTGPCIERKFHGGTERVTFETFAKLVIQDSDMAEHVARVMLNGEDPYQWNEDEAEFYETFTVMAPEVLRGQIERAGVV